MPYGSGGFGGGVYGGGIPSVLDLITAAAEESGGIGQGQELSGEDANALFVRLCWMLQQWQMKRWLVYHLITVGCVSTGAVSYSVGPGGDIAVGFRPDRLESAFFRQSVQAEPNQIDYPLELINAREDYNRIALKQLSAFPMYVFYDSSFATTNGLGAIFPWPVPQANIYSLYISVKEVLQKFTSLQEIINLPPEYSAAIHYNLAIRAAAYWKIPQDPAIIGLAKDSLKVLRGANAQIGRLVMPQDLVRGGIYNYYSDQVR